MKYLIIITLLALLLPSTIEAKITVLSVRGIAAYRSGSRWKPIKKGMTLKKGTELMTSARSSVKLNFDSHIVTLRQMSKIKLYRNILTKKKSVNQIGVKFGSINAKIKKTRKIKTIFKVSTPVATSSVRGTEEEVSYWNNRGMVINVISGVIDAQGKHGTLNRISGRQKFQMKKGSVRGNNILSSVRNKNITIISSPNSTDSEKESINLGLVETVDSPDSDNDSATGGRGITDILSETQKKNSAANIEVIWPPIEPQ